MVNPEEIDGKDATADYLLIKSKKHSSLIGNYCEYNPNKLNNPSAARKHKKIKFCGEIIVSK
jgi:hypothetical protein